MYIKINGEDTHYDVTFAPFTTQHGRKAIRFFGEIPDNDKGFTLYNDDDTVALDMSEYHYLYRHNEYANEYDEIEMPLGNNEPIPTNPIIARLNSMSAQISNITPYTESKSAYIDDEFLMFDIPKDGNISVFMVDADGQNVPHTFERINGQLRVSFEKRDSLATVTISIQ